MIIRNRFVVLRLLFLLRPLPPSSSSIEAKRCCRVELGYLRTLPHVHAAAGCRPPKTSAAERAPRPMNDVNHPAGTGVDNSPEKCTAAACVDAQTSRSIILDEATEASPGDAEEEKPPTVPSASAGIGASGVDPPSPDRPASPGVTWQEQRRLKSMRYDMLNRGPPLALAVLFLVVNLVRRYYQHKRQQIEWRRSSTDQLEMLRKRIHVNEHVHTNGTRDTEELRVDDGASEAEVKSNSQSVKDACEHKNDITPCAKKKNYSDQQLDESSYHATHDASNSQPASDHFSEIRAKQQEHLISRIKLNQRHLHREKIERKLMLHRSLDNLAADNAYQRRMNVIAEEQKLLRSRAGQEREQQPFIDLEELERIALLQQQNLEYQESLQIDQDRSRQLALIGEISLRREKALDEARERLEAAGVQSSPATQNKCVTGGNDNTSVTKVRLQLPSGQRIDGTFAAQHVVGLVYDLALVALDSNHGLWSQESGQGNGIRDLDSADRDICHSNASEKKNYCNIQKEWKNLFNSFSITSTFPRRTFDDLSITLGDCELSKCVTLMVVVEQSR